MAAPVVVIGGSGWVGSLTLPHLADTHPVVVYDRRPPSRELPGVSYRPGDATDHAGLAAVLAGADALVYMAMGPRVEPPTGRPGPDVVAGHADVTVKGLSLALLAAAAGGVRHVVYTSSMSVYQEPRERYPDETVPPDATSWYGLLKRLGEEVCRAVVAEHGLSVVALRLCHPVPDRDWPREAASGITTSATDTARALRAALAYRGHGFEAIAINGDRAQRRVRIDKAARLLDWRPAEQ